MRYVAIYDIADDNLRALVVETLKDYGLQRIQYSAFFGGLRRDELNSLLVDLKNLIRIRLRMRSCILFITRVSGEEERLANLRNTS